MTMKKNILVVDDEISICMLLENFLSQDFNVTFFRESKQALIWLESNLPDLIICDLQMAGIDGYQFLTRIRQRGFTRHTPVIMLSATSESSARIKCYRLGAQDYLIKPFNPQELEEVVRKNLFPIHYSTTW
jgi:DNA-binding response OmpR family regulator